MKIVKIFAVILLQFIVCQGIAQNCTFSKDETDKFTNSRVLYTEPVNLISEKIKNGKVYVIEKIEMQVKYENDTYMINLAYHFALGLSMANTNNKLILLLADGSIVEAACMQDIPSQKRKRNGVLIMSYNFKVTEEGFEQLLESDITDVRMAAYINQVEFSVSKEVKTRVLFDCINQNK